MRARLVSRSFVVGMVAFASGLLAAQAAVSNQAPPRGRGFIVGQVLDADGGRPIPAAMVQLSGGPTAAVEAGLLPPDAVIVPAGPRQVIADAAGRFIFRELVTGSYSVRATASGYITGSFGASRPGGAAQSIVLDRDDDRKGGLLIRMWKAASVSGRIVDEFGEPAIALQTRIFRRSFAGGRPRLSLGTITTTDDRGMYRFASLTPGEYVVALMFSATTVPMSASEAYFQAMTAGGAASEQLSNERSASGAPFPATTGFRVGDHMLTTGGGRGGTAFATPAEDGRVMNIPTTFYPGTTSASQAGVLALGSGEDRTGLDFQLRPRRAVAVSGTVTGPDGPVANIGVRLLIPGAEDFSIPTGLDAALTQTDASGRFTMLGVTPGIYTLQCVRVPRAQAQRFSPTSSIEVVGPGGAMMGMSSMGPSTTATLPLPVEPTLWAVMKVTVGDSDMNNLSVTLQPGARLSGRLAFEGGEAPPGDVLQRASISISSMAASMPSQVTGAQKRIEPDGRFATVGYPSGRYSLSASLLQGAAPGGPLWRFKQARIGGRDLTDEGLEVGLTDITNIELVFSSATAELRGTVVDARSQPDPSALVVVIPADSMAWKSGIISTRRIRGVRVSTTGAYALTGLPAGEYFIAAIPEGAFESWQDPKNLDTISRLASRVSLVEGNALSQRLTTVTGIK